MLALDVWLIAPCEDLLCTSRRRPGRLTVLVDHRWAVVQDIVKLAVALAVDRREVVRKVRHLTYPMV